MKIYMAGYYAGRGVDTEEGSMHLRVSRLIKKYPYWLESFHYIGDRPPLVKMIRSDQNKIFLDSGAFSMFTQGIEVDLTSYAKFIQEHKDIIDVASNLDAIGRGNEQLSYDRQKQLEAMDVDIKPVHHVRDADHWLQRYLDDGYDYIFLGGMVPENTPTLMNWLDGVWSKYLTNDDGTPKVKVHGFGLTTLSLMFRYPWYSVDSTSWVMTSRFGSIYLDMPQLDGTIKDYKVDFSDKSPRQREANSWHFNSLRPTEQKAVLERLEQLEAERIKAPIEADYEKEAGYKMGYYPEALAKSYGWRDYANIEYFRRAMNRRVDRFTSKQETLF